MRENEPFILHMKDRPTIYGLSEDNGTPDDDSASVDGGIPPAGEQDASVLTICPSLLFQMMKRVKRATGQLITQKKKKGSRLEVVSKDVGVLTTHLLRSHLEVVSKDVGVLTIRPSLLFQMMKRVKRATGQLIPQKKKGSRLEVVSKDVGVLTIRPSLLLQMMKRVKRATGQLIPQKKKGSRLEVVSKDVGVLTIRPSLLFQMMKRVKRATGQLIPQKKKGSRLEVVSKDVGVPTIRPSLLFQMMKRVKRATGQLIPQKKKGSRLEVVSKDVGVLTIRPSFLFQMMKRQLITHLSRPRLEVVSKLTKRVTGLKKHQLSTTNYKGTEDVTVEGFFISPLPPWQGSVSKFKEKESKFKEKEVYSEEVSAELS